MVRSQRLGTELTTAVKRQSVRIRKPKATVLDEYNQALALNDRIKYIVETLNREFPHMEEKFEQIMNTLNIFEPGETPELTAECVCEEREGGSENVAEKPLSP